jgi:hypothetical protein
MRAIPRSIRAGVLILGLAAAACSDMTREENRLLTGTAIGASGGALVGAIAGDAAAGAVVGAGVGLLGGVLMNEHEKAKQRAYEDGVRTGRQTATQ